MNPSLTILFVLLVLFIVLLIVTLFFIGSPAQTIQVSEGNYKVSNSAISVLLQGPNSGTSALVMQPRAQGTIIRIWNNTPNSITVLNDHITNTYDSKVSIGTAVNGLLHSQETIKCVNVDGLSQGALGNGSWQCTGEKQFS